MVWAIELALYTGQRRIDVLEMQWGHIKDGLISVAQQKTGERLLLPIHPDLAAVLDAIPRVGTTIIHRKDGRAYTGTGFLVSIPARAAAARAGRAPVPRAACRGGDAACGGGDRGSSNRVARNTERERKVQNIPEKV